MVISFCVASGPEEDVLQQEKDGDDAQRGQSSVLVCSSILPMFPTADAAVSTSTAGGSFLYTLTRTLQRREI